MKIYNENDLVDINLTPTQHDTANCFEQLKASQHFAGFPYGYTDNTSEAESKDVYFYNKSFSTGQLAEKVKLSTPAPASINCLRQMYCPECKQRLHEESVRLERLFKYCCFAMFPLYPCCMRRPESCKVICRKCGYYLGSWKRQ